MYIILSSVSDPSLNPTVPSAAQSEGEKKSTHTHTNKQCHLLASDKMIIKTACHQLVIFIREKVKAWTHLTVWGCLICYNAALIKQFKRKSRNNPSPGKTNAVALNLWALVALEIRCTNADLPFIKIINTQLESWKVFCCKWTVFFHIQHLCLQTKSFNRLILKYYKRQ